MNPASPEPGAISRSSASNRRVSGSALKLGVAAGGWVRVDAGGRRGWIPAEALAAPEPQGASPSPADEHAQK
jgi:uncharacterized protein YraI